MMHRTYIVKRKDNTYRIQRARRDLWKAWMYPLRFIKEMFRWFLLPFKLIRLIYWFLTGKLKPVWDGG